jgi:hypothetical protein
MQPENHPLLGRIGKIPLAFFESIASLPNSKLTEPKLDSDGG